MKTFENMYRKEAHEQDTRVRIFCKNGTILSPRLGKSIYVENAETMVAIVKHTVVSIESFVMIYKFISCETEEGMTLIQSCIDANNYELKYHVTSKQVDESFNHLLKTASKRNFEEQREVVYLGARNEG